MTEDKLARLRALIAEELEVGEERIRPEAALVEDLGADSLGIMEVVMAMEETFGVQVSETDVDRMRTVQDAIDYVETHSR